ncbi:LuxR C-terminal-related transcriptional regulator [Pseudomonas fluorescens]|uniref:Response regulator transcription factor n=1 Tax=Pseudomonas fluorescens TaxID=294 RepID=A0A944DK02_PSEFL|nr:LuxR C-terminal-related transcriptional regulator [Pseudomonas fluorescens]MBT2296420.1 response regulator transcription factor [Pseudomonas fluorescens]MBT2308758.1 response regulator transcription factor [Pseudomonas fluorescens]MBT2312746.1 response regulator transcription factor [Pseudomonas fluorescens]MBT2317876.1 response regulator transcription factor [Pseudomonas fluorescens]MBT2330059.1 response regulator transcription factor [Pseudomonas fluorescens]
MKKNNKDLTKREHEVLQLLLLGETNKKIALVLGISDFTVREHVSSILRKKGENSRGKLLSEKLNKL